MKILILDDIKVRHDTFDRIYSGDEVVHVYCYSDFVDKLNGSDWDLIHLDHDLDEFYSKADSYEDGWGKTQFYNGQHCVAKVIEKYADRKDLPRVIIHSINSVGSGYMRSDLERAGFNVSWELFTESKDWENDGM